MSLGRGARNDVVLTALQISRKHCIFKYDNNNRWGIQDFSTNGILINNNNVSKTSFTKLANGDLLHLIPGGILTYRFHHTRSRDLNFPPSIPGPLALSGGPRARTSAVAAAGRASGLLQLNEVSSASDASNLGTADLVLPRTAVSEDPEPPEDSFLSAVGAWDTSVSSVEGDLIPPHRSTATGLRRLSAAAGTGIPEMPSKRTYDFMKEYEEKTKKRCAAATVRNRKRLKGFSSMLVNIGGDVSSDSSDSEMESVVNQFKYRVPVGKDGKSKLRIETTTRPRDSSDENPSSEELNVLDNLFFEAPASSDRSPFSGPVIDVDNETDLGVLRAQVKFFMQKFRTATAETHTMSMRFQLEKDELSNQLVAANMQSNDQREALCRSLLQAMEHELNCCICNEVFMQASVIDCGHTFCFFCISEWSSKKRECPICRARIAHPRPTRHVEMENFIVKFHKLMAPDIQVKRRRLLQERVEEEAKAKEEARVAAATARAAQARAAQRGRMDGLPDRFVNLLVELQQLNDTFGDAHGHAPRARPRFPFPAPYFNRVPQAQAAAPIPPEGLPYDNPNDPRVRGGGGRGQEQQVPNNSFVTDPPYTRRARRGGVVVGLDPIPAPLQNPAVINLDDSQEIVPEPPQPLPLVVAAQDRPEVNFIDRFFGMFGSPRGTGGT